VVACQEEIPIAESATALVVVNLMMQLGVSLSVSAAQTIFRNRLIVSMQQYAPGVSVDTVVNAGATDIRRLVSVAQLPGVIYAYNDALTRMFVSYSNPLLTLY
jgi:hypothetical protein